MRGNDCRMEDGRREEVVAGNGWPTPTGRMFSDNGDGPGNKEMKCRKIRKKKRSEFLPS